MSVEKVRQYLKQYGLDSRVEEFDVSSATVELAAKVVGRYQSEAEHDSPLESRYCTTGESLKE